MLKCWARIPDERPTFVDLVGILSTSLDSKAGYLNVTAFSGHRCSILTPKPEHAAASESIQESPGGTMSRPHTVRRSPHQSLQNLYIDKN